MNRHQKKVLSLAAAIANLSFSVIVTGVATYAWYTTNVVSRLNVSETTTSITSKENINLNYDIYKYNYDAKAGTKRAKTDFVLPEYDDYIVDKNVYANIILRADVEFSYNLDTSSQALVINIEKLINDFKISKSSGGNTYNNVINNKTSNVIQFKTVVYSYTTTSNPSTPTIVTSAIKEENGDYDSSGANDYKTDDDAVYSSASAYFKTGGTSNSFVTIYNNEATRVYDTNLVVIPNLSGTGVLTNAVIYIECSYQDSLVDKYIESQPAVLLDDSYDLDGDISSITFDLADVYTITYHSNNGGDTTVTEQSMAGTYVLKPANTFSYTGHTFNKWAVGSTSGTKYSAGATYTVSGNTAFYATWTTNNYTVTYNANGGTVSPTSETVAYGGHPTLPTPTRANYTFDGWQVNGAGAYVTSSYVVTDNVTLKAHWTSAGFTVSFNANGGSGSMSSVSNVSGSYTLPNCSFTAPTNYSFAGWTVGAPTNGDYTAKDQSITVSSNITLYARWKCTDTINRATTGVTSGTTNYSDWSGKTASSSAVYAGNSAGGNNSIQLRSNNNNSGVVTTTSGGYVTSVVVTWNSNTSSGRTLDVYTKTSAYSAASDLYSSNTRGTNRGSIVYGTSTTITLSGTNSSGTFIGMRSNNNAMYITSIAITWVK